MFAGETIDKVNKFKKWFWSILEKMTNSQKHDLVIDFKLVYICYVIYISYEYNSFINS